MAKKAKSGCLRRMFWTMLMIVGMVLIAIVAGLVWRIDDWRRDLWHNRASTSDDSPDPILRPIHSELPPDAVIAVIQQAAARLPNWTEGAIAREANQIRMAFVRTTPLLRFNDDITVRVQLVHGKTVVHAESKSRIGKGDLGQNPRNLRELFTAVRAELEEVEAEKEMKRGKGFAPGKRRR